MAERRSLVAGLAEAEEIDPKLAEEFIYQKPRKSPNASPPVVDTLETPAEETPAPATPPLPPSVLTAAQVTTSAATSPLTGVGRVPIGARVRIPLADAFKRASLERQLQGIQPNSMQDLLEEAMELWLLKHGLLK